MHPINSLNFGKTHKKLQVSVRNVGNTATIDGTVVKQIGTKRFVITTDGGTTTRVCNLAQTAADVTAMDGGDQGICVIEVTEFGGSPEKIKSIFSKTVVTHAGERLKYKLGVTATVAGEGTVRAVLNSPPTVVNPIPDQVATVAAAFSFVIPSNTFSDFDGHALTLSMGAVTDFAFDPVTNTVSKAAGDGAAGTVTVTITADDGNGGTVADSFDVVVS